MQNKPTFIIPQNLLPKQIKPQTDEEIYAKSYNKEDILGCKHYSRNCKIKAFCCQRFYVCRLCHNENLDHEINRHATKEILCMFCDTIQPVSNQCANKECKKQFGHYFCDICVFFDNDQSKSLFHCDGCGICRVGKRENYIHCDKCKLCLAPQIFKSHNCIQDIGMSNCPICMDDIFSSREESMTLDCGHRLHYPCYKDLIASKSYKCPICKKSLGKLDWSRHDRLVQRSRMPEMYAGSTVSILCNDCNVKSSDLPLHFLGQKCPKCESFNTTETSRNLTIDKTKSSDFVVVQDDESNTEDDEGDDTSVSFEEGDEEDEQDEDDEQGDQTDENNN
ncbi:hypothetical protein DICPUDRAFT_29076 [Dictyostelium purpureum]|uniref:Uncharacterized protein n=1 Tax=Dictyostelium purpureum TaxID=5786 RepID=F0ZCV7_DICPU|nr:uncharacterized protein DICPUDRAFT_29076 [Dictyostelium purpureum]EGC38203.1 hypothetical protein DICPUDRAFT_29076 [Dictyostelium purpureum]|eukprot:XP_003285241.1 hypothetical protein DICPUDRAFT_29076 [Dictyostelium purpureum]